MKPHIRGFMALFPFSEQFVSIVYHNTGTFTAINPALFSPFPGLLEGGQQLYQRIVLGRNRYGTDFPPHTDLLPKIKPILPEFLIPYFIPTETMSLRDLSQIDQQNIVVFRCFFDHSIGKPTL